MQAVRVHIASGCYLATLFETWRRWDGTLIWNNVGIHTVPRRSEQEAIADGKELARERGAIFLGSGLTLRNQIVLNDPRSLARWMGVSIEDAQRVADALHAEKEHARAVHDMLTAIVSEGKS